MLSSFVLDFHSFFRAPSPKIIRFQSLWLLYRFASTSTKRSKPFWIVSLPIVTSLLQAGNDISGLLYKLLASTSTGLGITWTDLLQLRNISLILSVCTTRWPTKWYRVFLTVLWIITLRDYNFAWYKTSSQQNENICWAYKTDYTVRIRLQSKLT